MELQQLNHTKHLRLNRHRLYLIGILWFNEKGDDGDVLARIRDGARAMAKARRMRDGLDVEIVGECVVEETILCIVLTNAVEVQVSGGPGVGIAVYDVAFSWINHSCSPNACYRFSLEHSSIGESQLLIVPGSYDRVEATKYNDSNVFGLKDEGEKLGPRIVVRSIRAIEVDEAVFVSYTDLLQPKAMRQAELWSKYRFLCSCQRCSASPATYVDRILQEIFAVNCDGGFISSDYEDEANERFATRVDDAINEYLTYGNPKSCCEKFEMMLINGILEEQLESKEATSKRQFFLHPAHYLSLNAYTTLSSAYKTQASELLALRSEGKSFQLQAFNMHRTSAAYSLLLAGATHHLFLSESSLVVSAANFWTQAGESLVNVARSTVWESLPNLRPTAETCWFLHEYHTYASGSRPTSTKAFEEMSSDFFVYVTSILPKVWPFLVHKGYLELIKDPIDFGWIENIDSTRLSVSKNNLYGTATEASGSRSGVFVCSEQENINLFQLGVHCLLYGCFLLSTFCGQSPHSDLHIENLLADCILEN